MALPPPLMPETPGAGSRQQLEQQGVIAPAVRLESPTRGYASGAPVPFTQGTANLRA